MWAKRFGEVCETLSNACNSTMAPRFPDTSWELALERQVKVFYIYPFLILRKISVSTADCSMNMIIKQQLGIWKSMDYHKLVEEYERDVVLVNAVNHKSQQQK